MPSQRVGRRGGFLILFALVYIGMGLMLTLLPGIEKRLEGLRWVLDFAHDYVPGLPFSPLLPFTLNWALCGVLALIAAFQVRPLDWFGFSALVLAPALWGSMYFIGVMFAGSPTSGLLSTLIYWLFAGAPMIVSGMQGDKDRDEREVII